MDFAYDDTIEELRQQVYEFVHQHVVPAEDLFAQQLTELDSRWMWSKTPVLLELQREARERGLWNLFLGGEHGAGLTNLQYAPLAEIMGWSHHLAPAAMNCSAPDTGNIELLAMFGSPEQQDRWLRPLLDGQVRSSFAMTEPAVASSDATNIETRIERDGDSYRINGRKWFTTGAMNPLAEVLIVMGKTDPDAHRHRQQSMIIVPRQTPGVHVQRAMTVFGYDDQQHGGHAEIVFDDVRVPASHLLGQEGEGFAIAQARLGPGRIHHCMRTIGMAERAVELMVARANDRTAFGRRLAEQGVIRNWVAESRVRIEQLRLLVLKAAWAMDVKGNRAAHADIQAIKIAAPAAVEWIIDKAIQVHGGAGLSQDFPLAGMQASVRTLRIADGPDEVHRNAIGRDELRRGERGTIDAS